MIIDASTEPAPPAAGNMKRNASGIIFLIAACCYAVYLVTYYSTGLAGPTHLAVQMVPASLILICLNDLRTSTFYPRLTERLQVVLAVLQISAALAAGAYLTIQFDAIRIARMGNWNWADHLAGGTLVLLVLELTRRKYLPVFILNLLLLLYAVYGHLVPGIFSHPGLSWSRANSALSLEMATGIFERLPQLGLTLIGSFLLVLAVLQAFGCIDSLLKAGHCWLGAGPAFCHRQRCSAPLAWLQ